MEWLLVLLSVTGTWLNIRKKPICWIVWSAANLGWIATFISRGMTAEATLFVVYLTLSVYGLKKWRSEQTFRRRIKPFTFPERWQIISRIHIPASGRNRF